MLRIYLIFRFVISSMLIWIWIIIFRSVRMLSCNIYFYQHAIHPFLPVYQLYLLSMLLFIFIYYYYFYLSVSGINSLRYVSLLFSFFICILSLSFPFFFLFPFVLFRKLIHPRSLLFLFLGPLSLTHPQMQYISFRHLFFFIPISLSPLP